MQSNTNTCKKDFTFFKNNFFGHSRNFEKINTSACGGLGVGARLPPEPAV